MKRLLMICLLVLVGCGTAKRPLQPTVHLGQLSDFDGYVADVLYTTQTTLNGLNQHVADYPQAQPVLRQATQDYNLLYRVYVLYRCGVGAKELPGGASCPTTPAPTQADVSALLEKSAGSLVKAQQAIGGK